MGVVSGIIMPFQFGTNWSRFSDDVANVLSPLLAYEGLTAFFLEAAFLGVLLFGRKLVPRWAHFFAALMVALGTLASTFWILAANSWMQTPAGYEMVDGRFMPKDWLEIIFNPSFPYRLAHTVVAVYITTGFVVVGVAACVAPPRALRRRGAHDAVDDAVAAHASSSRCRLFSATSTASTRSSISRPSSPRSRRSGTPAAALPLSRVRHSRRRGRDEPLRDFDPGRSAASS